MTYQHLVGYLMSESFFYLGTNQSNLYFSPCVRSQFVFMVASLGGYQTVLMLKSMCILSVDTLLYLYVVLTLHARHLAYSKQHQHDKIYSI